MYQTHLPPHTQRPTRWCQDAASSTFFLTSGGQLLAAIDSEPRHSPIHCCQTEKAKTFKGKLWLLEETSIWLNTVNILSLFQCAVGSFTNEFSHIYLSCLVDVMVTYLTGFNRAAGGGFTAKQWHVQYSGTEVYTVKLCISNWTEVLCYWLECFRCCCYVIGRKLHDVKWSKSDCVANIFFYWHTFDDEILVILSSSWWRPVWLKCVGMFVME